MKIIVLKPIDGGLLIEKKDVAKLDLKTMYDLIGCETIDIKNIPKSVWSNIGCIPEMAAVFDDEFLLRHEEPVANPVASALYGYFMHDQCLCGTVLLCNNGDDGDLEGFDDAEADELVKKLIEINAKVCDIDFIVQEPKIKFMQF